jgi:hypothetical protein
VVVIARPQPTPFPLPQQEERVAVAFDAEVKLHSVGERYSLQPPRQMKVGEVPTTPLAGLSSSQIEPFVVTHTAEVETTAIRTVAGEYRDIKVEAARLRRGLGDLANYTSLGPVAGTT